MRVLPRRNSAPEGDIDFLSITSALCLYQRCCHRHMMCPHPISQQKTSTIHTGSKLLFGHASTWIEPLRCLCLFLSTSSSLSLCLYISFSLSLPLGMLLLLIISLPVPLSFSVCLSLSVSVCLSLARCICVSPTNLRFCSFFLPMLLPTLAHAESASLTLSRFLSVSSLSVCMP